MNTLADSIPTSCFKKRTTPLPEQRSGVHSFAPGEWLFLETGFVKLRNAAEGAHCTAERCSAANNLPSLPLLRELRNSGCHLKYPFRHGFPIDQYLQTVRPWVVFPGGKILKTLVPADGVHLARLQFQFFDFKHLVGYFT